MTTNNNLLEKADLAISDLTGNNAGGYLQPQQGDNFIRKLILQPSIMRECRVIVMTQPEREVNKIGFGKRILRTATSATPLADALRAKPQTEQFRLKTKEQIAEVRLPYDVLEDNIERAMTADNGAHNTGPGGLRQTIIDLIAERAALDLEELGLMAHTGYATGDASNLGFADELMDRATSTAYAAADLAYLSQLNGWLAYARGAVSEDGRPVSGGNVVEVQGVPISKEVFKDGMKAMPKQYLREKAMMKHFVSTNNEIEYRDTLANRTGNLGDGMTTGERDAFAYGSPVFPVTQMPNDRGLYTHPKNLIFGIQRQVSMEYDKDIRARVYIIVLTCRIDFQVEEPEAISYYSNIGES